MGQALSKRKNGAKFEINDENFIRNGGILLEKQIALSQSRDIGSQQLKIFSFEDMKSATNCFDPRIMVGRIRSTVYKGTVDDRTMAIKVPFDLNPTPQIVDLFLTEASIGSVMSHSNMMKLYGCCLEIPLPILVYEYASNGSLYQRLHGGNSAFRNRLKWADRLRIATDASYALSYMHNGLEKPVVHRDVQSLSLLLDESFRAKLTNFGLSVSITNTPGEEPQRWPVEGKPGYIDPDYVETQEVTDKCDVYSFGVLMLELLTGREPSMMSSNGTDLVHVFVSSVQNNSMMKMIDKEVLKQGSTDEIQLVVNLALRCVAKKGMERPFMIEVVSELWRIQGLQKHSCSPELAMTDAKKTL